MKKRDETLDWKGFTLMELIVVMAVIGVLVLLAAPRFLGQTERAREAAIVNDIKAAEGKVSEYLMRHEGFPEDWVEIGDGEWTNLSEHLYGRKGEALDIVPADYRLLPEGFVKSEVRSRLDGSFFADTDGNVYYSPSPTGTPVAGEPEDTDEQYFEWEIVGGGSAGWELQGSVWIQIPAYMGAAITGYSDEGPRDVVIPATLGGYEIIEFGEGAFQGKGLTGVTFQLPKEKDIYFGENAFADNQLTELIIQDADDVTVDDTAFANNHLDTIRISDINEIAFYKQVFVNNPIETLTLHVNDYIDFNDLSFASSQIENLHMSGGVNGYDLGGNSFENTKIGKLRITDTRSLGIRYHTFKSSEVGLIEIERVGEWGMVIWDNAFEDATVNSLSIKNSGMVEILDHAFSQSGLEFLEIGGLPELYIGRDAFRGNQLTAVNIYGIEVNPYNKILQGAFRDNPLETLTMPAGFYLEEPFVPAGTVIKLQP